MDEDRETLTDDVTTNDGIFLTTKPTYVVLTKGEHRETSVGTQSLTTMMHFSFLAMNVDHSLKLLLKVVEAGNNDLDE